MTVLADPKVSKLTEEQRRERRAKNKYAKQIRLRKRKAKHGRQYRNGN